MTYVLGKQSLAKLAGVHNDLARVVKRAIELSAADFGVHEGLRTIETQREYLKRGVTKTLQSRHLSGHAVDLVPYIAGTLRWEWEPIYHIAVAMARASQELIVPLRWGGVWDKTMNEYAGNAPDAAKMKAAVQEYCVRHPGPDFLDGPHFELPSSQYKA